MPRPAAPTILDVARRAGVSKSLVSLVMRGSPNVSDEKRTAVLRAAEALGYRPNAAARSLASRRSHVIGVMLSDVLNPFFTELIGGIEEAAIAAEYRALFNTGSRNPELEAVAIDTFLELRTDGLILAGPVLDEDVIAEAAREVPVVVMTRQIEVPGVDSVSNDDYRGAGMVVDHLVELRHRHIAHIDGGSGAGARRRRQGFLRRMRKHGLAETARVVAGTYTEEGGAKGVLELLASGPPPTAIFASNDLAAVGALHALEDQGLAVPEDVSLVGYDNTTLAQLGHIALTTIHQPRREMGFQAVQLLIERLDGGRSEPRHILIEPSLMARRTTAPPRRDAT